jgi:hypothetical protein
MTAPVNPPEYNPGIPIAENTIAESQTNFLGNFSTLFNAFGINHVNLDDLTNPGNHNVIQLTEQNSGKSTESQEICIYSKKVANQTDQLFMRYPSNGKEFQITNYQIYSIKPTATQEAYFSFLPGGVIVYFGKVMPTKNDFPINLNPAICTNITGVNLCPIGKSGSNISPSNVKLVEIGVPYSQVILTSSFLIQTPPNQYYLIFGNI